MLSLDSKFAKNSFRWITRIAIYFSLFSLLLPFFEIGTNDLYEIGNFFGSMAAVVFVLTDIPGIFRRFKVSGVFKQIQNNLMFSRAHLGTLMFLFAFNHYVFVFLLETIQTQNFAKFPLLFEIFGIIALYGTFPLFITSNQWAKKKMKKWWGRLHKIVYGLIWAIFIHVALVGNYLIAGLIGITAVLQLMSLLLSYLEKADKKSAQKTISGV
jgi:sulfoxide reductase heme-binding subunit YedZ